MEPITIGLLIATAVAGTATAVQQKKSAEYQADVLEKQAEDEETQARERELIRKQKINKVLSAQIAGLGASGITSEGSPQLIATESIRQESLGDLAETSNRSGRSNLLKNKANATRQLGKMQSGVTLLNTAVKSGLMYEGTL